MAETLASWSHSRVIEFEKCKRRAFLLHVEKVAEPERPLPPGKTEHANDRGSRIHEACEHFVKGTGAFPIEAKSFRAELEKLQRLYAAGQVSLEGEWGMNRRWEPTGWAGAWELVEDWEGGAAPKVKALPDRGRAGDAVTFQGAVYLWVPAWLRLKLDALVHLSPQEAVAIDYKTGKRFGNEIKHAEQLQLYQLVTFLRFPLLERVTTELWYLDADDLAAQSFTRQQGLRFQRAWDNRGNAATTCIDFPPNPNLISCRYCGYGPWGTGHCSVGVQNLPRRA